MVRALASPVFGSGSNPCFDAICGLSLLLVVSFAPRGFSPGYSGPVSNSNSTRNQADRSVDVLTSISLFIHAVSMCNQTVTREIRE